MAQYFETQLNYLQFSLSQKRYTENDENLSLATDFDMNTVPI